MVTKVIFKTKSEDIHPHNILGSIKQSFLTSIIDDSKVVLSYKYLQEFINCSTAKREGNDDSQVIFTHVHDNSVYETTLTAMGTNQEDVYYVVDQILCNENGKIINSYCMNNKNDSKRLVCFVRSPERGNDLLKRIAKQQQTSTKKSR